MPFKLTRGTFVSATAILIYISVVELLAHLLTANNYGYFIDELYTIACGKHLAFGYVDIPPLVPALSRLSGLLLGYSLFAVHVLPALAGGLTVFMAGLVARRLDGGRFAQALTGILVALGPMWLIFNSWIAYDGIDQLVMVTFFTVVLGLLRQDKPMLREWILFGVVAGIGLMTKGSMLFYGFAFLLGMLLTDRRRNFTQGGLWIGGAIALAIFTPYIVWQYLHGWPVIEYWGMYGRFRTYHASPLEFLIMQIITVNPLTLPLWAAGLFFFFSKSGRQYRTIGWMFPILFVIFAAVNAKFYMLTAAFIPLLAAGAVQLERFTSSLPRRWLRPAYTATVALLAIIFLPIALPILPVRSLVAYIKGASFIMGAVKTDNAQTIELPQFIADRFGWDTMVKAVAEVYNGLTPAEQEECVIVAGSYGPAGAIDLLGPAYGLPNASSGHLSYFFWGPGKKSGRVAIGVQMSRSDLLRYFTEVEQKAIVRSDYAMPYNTNMPVWVCRGARFESITDVWPQAKHFD
jgi:4-amino-4-deoxy-L-arabinose transferase-like glycosyltransferase